MAPTKNRRLPVGIQSFKVIRENEYVYVDKTDIVWHLVNDGVKYNYLSRPRRFGKSLLVDTMQTYLEGRKELFNGLRITRLEHDWLQYPVIRLDMSRGGTSATTIQSYLNNAFKVYEAKYGIQPSHDDSLADRLDAIIKKAFDVTGLPACILIDEYDSPLQHSWKTPEHKACTDVYRDVFAILKADDEYEKIVFITGITKFTQISLFSVLNNLSNISFEAEYAAICGITQNEVAECFKPEIERMAEANGWTQQQTLDNLKDYYDGYHFSHKNMVDVFNPFSLINALADKDIKNYWAASGATSLLPKFVDDLDIRLKDFENCPIDSDTLQTSDVTDGGAELFLFQSGYLTIKKFQYGMYILGIPNLEVRKALYKIVLPTLTMKSNSQVISTQNMLMLAMSKGNVPEGMKCLKALISDVPYSNKRLASMDMEERYRLIISTILNAIGIMVEVEHMLSTGRIDILAKTPSYIYVMELKLTKNGGLKAAENQITTNNYLEPFKADKRKVVGLAIELDDMGKGVVGWSKI